MRLELRGAGVGAELPATSAILDPGSDDPAPVVVAVDTDLRPRLLALLLGGHVRPTVGEVLVDDRVDPRALRRRVAVVDAPFASEPPAGVALRVVVAEELAYAGHRATRGAVDDALAGLGLADDGGTRIDLLPSLDRVRVLAELAARRPGVEALVLTSPERHGTDPDALWPTVSDLARRGLLVAVVTDSATAARLRALGARDGSPSIPDLPDIPDLPEEQDA